MADEKTTPADPLREAFEDFCRRKCSPHAEGSDWYWTIYQDAWRAALATKPAEPAPTITERELEVDPFAERNAVFAAVQPPAPEPRRPLPHPGSPEASAMLDSMLAEYDWPANPKNAARAGWEAAQRYLRTTSPAREQRGAVLTDEQIMDIAREFALSGRWPSDWIDFGRALALSPKGKK